jgi:hypothetical protein
MTQAGRFEAISGRGVVVGLALIGLMAVGPEVGYAHELLSSQAREEPTTAFETLLVEICSPCVRDSYAVAALPIVPSRPLGFGPAVTSVMARGGEVRFELVRAYPLGKVSQQFLAMRVTLFIKTGDGQLYPIATGLLDEEEVTILATAVDDISKTASIRRAEELTPDTTEMEFHAGSLRVGTLRIRGAEVAYIQAGNVQSLRAPTPFETTSAMFLPVSDLPAVHHAIGQVAHRIRKLRGL